MESQYHACTPQKKDLFDSVTSPILPQQKHVIENLESYPSFLRTASMQWFAYAKKYFSRDGMNLELFSYLHQEEVMRSAIPFLQSIEGFLPAHVVIDESCIPQKPDIEFAHYGGLFYSAISEVAPEVEVIEVKNLPYGVGNWLSPGQLISTTPYGEVNSDRWLTLGGKQHFAFTKVPIDEPTREHFKDLRVPFPDDEPYVSLVNWGLIREGVMFEKASPQIRSGIINFGTIDDLYLNTNKSGVVCNAGVIIRSDIFRDSHLSNISFPPSVFYLVSNNRVINILQRQLRGNPNYITLNQLLSISSPASDLLSLSRLSLDATMEVIEKSGGDFKFR